MSNIVLSSHASEQVPGSPYHQSSWKKLDDIAAMQKFADDKRMVSLVQRYRKAANSAFGALPIAGSMKGQRQQERQEMSSSPTNDNDSGDDIERLECR